MKAFLSLSHATGQPWPLMCLFVYCRIVGISEGSRTATAVQRRAGQHVYPSAAVHAGERAREGAVQVERQHTARHCVVGRADAATSDCISAEVLSRAHDGAGAGAGRRGDWGPTAPHI